MNSPNASLIGNPRSRQRLATPALLIDLDDLEHNLRHMAGLCRKANLALRPHAKTHKSVHIAKLQIEAGAVGICAATLREAEVMVEAGIPGVLLTSPVVGAANIERCVALARRSRELLVAADNPANVRALAAALARAGAKAAVLVDVDIGMHRTGIPDVAGVLALVRQIRASKALHFAGLQAYSGAVQHIARAADRSRTYGRQLRHLDAVIQALHGAGIEPGIISGGGTGTFDTDRRAGLFTETQCGSYVFMDVEYDEVQLFARGANPYRTALRVQSMIVSNNHPGFATIDGGFKCFHMHGPLPRLLTGAPRGTIYEFFGDEFGKLVLPRKVARQSAVLKMGSKVELAVPHCDPTANLHNVYHCVRGNTLVDIWPIDARGSL
jgi:3-hydroxy-D-aspartate aldolase